MTIHFNTKDNGVAVVKKNKTEVLYYLFDEYEIHLNQIPSHSNQEWHYHKLIEEIILVTDGELLCSWLENGQRKEKIIYKNELVQVKDSIHTFSNTTNRDTTFIVFRLILDGKNKRELIKKDKELFIF